MAAGRSAAAQEDQPGGDERPQKGDLLVLSEGDRQGEVVRPGDLTLGGPPVHAWPQDPKSSVIRKGPRLNEILVIKLDPGELDEETRSRSADGIVAYSVICTHAGFPVSEWVKAGRRQGHSEMSLSQLRGQPRESAQVVFGPAPTFTRAPMQITDGSLTVAGTFVGKVGDQRAKKINKIGSVFALPKKQSEVDQGGCRL